MKKTETRESAERTIEALRKDLGSSKNESAQLRTDLLEAKKRIADLEKGGQKIKAEIEAKSKKYGTILNERRRLQDEVETLKVTIGDLYSAAKDLGFDYSSGFLGVEIPPDGPAFDNANVGVKMRIEVGRVRAIIERLENDISYGPDGRSYMYYRYTIQLVETLRGILSAAKNQLEKKKGDQ